MEGNPKNHKNTNPKEKTWKEGLRQKSLLLVNQIQNMRSNTIYFLFLKSPPDAAAVEDQNCPIDRQTKREG